MAVINRELFTAQDMSLTVFCGPSTNATGLIAAAQANAGRVGINISGTFAGTLTFYASADGVTFAPVGVTPFASGTNVSTATATGNWFFDAQNYVAFKVYFTSKTSGNPIVTLAVANNDATWQDAFLASTTIYVNSQAVAGVNTLTQALQANRAWCLSFLQVSTNQRASWVTNPNLKVVDGTGGSTLFALDLMDVGSSGYIYDITLPLLDDGTGRRGLVGTVGNAMIITVASGGSGVKTNINAKFRAA